MPETSDLVERAQQGSREAFSQLILQHQGHVRAFIGRYIRGGDVVDDLAQDAFLKAYRSLPTYRAEAPFRGWLLGIARHVMLDHLGEERRRRKTASLEGDLGDWLADALQSQPVELIAQEQEISAMQKCIQGLPQKSAKLVRDFYFEGRSAREIVQESGRSQGGLWVTLLRIRRALRECVEMRLQMGKGI